MDIITISGVERLLNGAVRKVLSKLAGTNQLLAKQVFIRTLNCNSPGTWAETTNPRKAVGTGGRQKLQRRGARALARGRGAGLASKHCPVHPSTQVSGSPSVAPSIPQDRELVLWSSLTAFAPIPKLGGALFDECPEKQ